MSMNEEIFVGEGVSDGLFFYFEVGKFYWICMINMGIFVSKYFYNIFFFYLCFKVVEYILCCIVFWVVLEGYEMYIIEMDGVEVVLYFVDVVFILVV